MEYIREKNSILPNRTHIYLLEPLLTSHTSLKYGSYGIVNVCFDNDIGNAYSIIGEKKFI